MSAADEPEIRIERYAILRNHVIIQWTDEHGEARGQTVAVRAAVFDNAHRDMTEPPRMTLPWRQIASYPPAWRRRVWRWRKASRRR